MHASFITISLVYAITITSYGVLYVYPKTKKEKGIAYYLYTILAIYLFYIIVIQQKFYFKGTLGFYRFLVYTALYKNGHIYISNIDPHSSLYANLLVNYILSEIFLININNVPYLRVIYFIIVFILFSLFAASMFKIMCTKNKEEKTIYLSLFIATSAFVVLGDPLRASAVLSYRTLGIVLGLMLLYVLVSIIKPMRQYYKSNLILLAIMYTSLCFSSLQHALIVLLISVVHLLPRRVTLKYVLYLFSIIFLLSNVYFTLIYINRQWSYAEFLINTLLKYPITSGFTRKETFMQLGSTLQAHSTYDNIQLVTLLIARSSYMLALFLICLLGIIVSKVTNIKLLKDAIVVISLYIIGFSLLMILLTLATLLVPYERAFFDIRNLIQVFINPLTVMLILLIFNTLAEDPFAIKQLINRKLVRAFLLLFLLTIIFAPKEVLSIVSLTSPEKASVDETKVSYPYEFNAYAFLKTFSEGELKICSDYAFLQHCKVYELTDNVYCRLMNLNRIFSREYILVFNVRGVYLKSIYIPSYVYKIALSNSYSGSVLYNNYMYIASILR